MNDRRAPRTSFTASAPKAAASISAARLAAFEILERVATTSEHSDDLLHGRRLAGLSQQDKNLATALVLGVLRWQIALDAQVRPLLQRPELQVAQPILTALRIGAFQLIHMDRVPAHAALSESVELVRAAGQPHAAGLVNAVLRKLAVKKGPEGRKLHESTAALAERLGHPGWLVERWAKHYGRKAATAICEFDQHEPEVGKLFASNELHGEASGGEGADSLPQLDDGSRLVAEIAAASQSAAHRVWDCCAAPGGKTLVLAVRQPEADLLATDVNQRRLAAMQQRFGESKRHANIRLEVADATELEAKQEMFDLILCDVPCSGTGTLGRNPEIRHHLRPSDLARQAERQRAILTGALRHLTSGGRLLYSTCSLEPEENEAVVAAVQRPGVVRLDIAPVLETLRERGLLASGVETAGLVRDGFLRTLPGANFAGDGFFAALLTVV